MAGCSASVGALPRTGDPTPPDRYESLRALIPGLRMWRARLSEKIDHAENEFWVTVWTEEREELEGFIAGLVRIAGEPKR